MVFIPGGKGVGATSAREEGLVLPGLDEMVSQLLLEMLSASWQPGFRAGRDFVANPEAGMRIHPSISGMIVGNDGKMGGKW